MIDIRNAETWAWNYRKLSTSGVNEPNIITDFFLRHCLCFKVLRPSKRFVLFCFWVISEPCAPWQWSCRSVRSAYLRLQSPCFLTGRGSSWLPLWRLLSLFAFLLAQGSRPSPHSTTIIQRHWPDSRSVRCLLATWTFLSQSLRRLTCVWWDYESFLFILKMRKAQVYWGGNLPQATESKLQSQDLSMKALKHKHLINGFWEQHL